MQSDAFEDDYRPRDSVGDVRSPRSLLATIAVLLALVVAAVAVGRAVVSGQQEDERRARLEQHRPVGWVSGIDRGSHSRTAIPRAEFENLVLGKTPAEVWERFPNGPMPEDINAAEKLEFIGETADPTDGSPDAEIEVFFEGGKAVRVRYL